MITASLRSLAPVVVFTYNRPEHTRRTVAALAANDLAAHTPLIVYADAAANEAAAPAVTAVSRVLDAVTGFASVTIHRRECNYGLADSIADGVSTIIKMYGRVIVMEDDLVTSPCFLRYMNKALDRYVDDDRVMHVAAHMPDIDPTGLPQSFFLRQSSCWGWATWERAWRRFHRNADRFVQNFDLDDIHRFNLDGAFDYWSQLLANRDGHLKTWAVFWYACVFAAGGLCLHPRASLVANIGHDGSGTNCGASDAFCQKTSALPITTFPDDLVEHTEAMRRYQAALRTAVRGNVPDGCRRQGFLKTLFGRLKSAATNWT